MIVSSDHTWIRTPQLHSCIFLNIPHLSVMIAPISPQVFSPLLSPVAIAVSPYQNMSGRSCDFTCWKPQCLLRISAGVRNLPGFGCELVKICPGKPLWQLPERSMKEWASASRRRANCEVGRWKCAEEIIQTIGEIIQ